MVTPTEPVNRRPGRPPLADTVAKVHAKMAEAAQGKKQGRLKKEVLDESPSLLDYQKRTYGSRREAKTMARKFPGIPFFAKYSRATGAERHIRYEFDGENMHGEYLTPDE